MLFPSGHTASVQGSSEIAPSRDTGSLSATLLMSFLYSQKLAAEHTLFVEFERGAQHPLLHCELEVQVSAHHVLCWYDMHIDNEQHGATSTSHASPGRPHTSSVVGAGVGGFGVGVAASTTTRTSSLASSTASVASVTEASPVRVPPSPSKEGPAIVVGAHADSESAASAKMMLTVLRV